MLSAFVDDAARPLAGRRPTNANSSYLFVWPALGGLLGLTLSRRLSPAAPIASAATFLGSIPSLILLAPLTRSHVRRQPADSPAGLDSGRALHRRLMPTLGAPLITPGAQTCARSRSSAEKSATVELEVEHPSQVLSTLASISPRAVQPESR